MRTDLFTAKEELLTRYDAARVNRILRLRDLYERMLAEPDIKDKTLVDDITTRYGIRMRQAYEDLQQVKELLPQLQQASQAYHRHRFNEMILEVYRKAKAEGDLRTMERAASSYARFNKINEQDTEQMPYEDIVIQPFVPSSDPRLIGIEPIKNLDEVKRKLLKQLGEFNPDIEEINYEDADIRN